MIDIPVTFAPGSATLSTLLCLRRERPKGCRAAEQRDEIAPIPINGRTLKFSSQGFDRDLT
jgi:hypothetical protein